MLYFQPEYYEDGCAGKAVKTLKPAGSMVHITFMDAPGPVNIKAVHRGKINYKRLSR